MRLREPRHPSTLAGSRCVVSGRAAEWAETAAQLTAASAHVIAFHDPRDRVWPLRFRGLPVVRGALDRRFGDALVVIAGKPTKAWFNACARGLERCAWQQPLPDWQRRGRYAPQLTQDEQTLIRTLFDSLQDEASRDVLASIVRARLEGDTGFQRISPYREYDHPVVHAEAGDFVIDAGACVGDTATMFAWQVGPRGQVLALEPEQGPYQALSQRSAHHPFRNITPLRQGAWSERATLRFDQRGAGSSTISADGTSQIEVTSVDALVTERRLPRVDLIKMDIEGAEREALRGAEQTVLRFRPKLQISLYHRQTDLYLLPAQIRDMVDDYRFFLGHHSHYHMETDLYAVPRERSTPSVYSAHGSYDRLYRALASRLGTPRWPRKPRPPRRA